MRKGAGNTEVIASTNNLMEPDHLGKQKAYYTISLVSYSQIKTRNHKQANEKQVKKINIPNTHFGPLFHPTKF